MEAKELAVPTTIEEALNFFSLFGLANDPQQVHIPALSIKLLDCQLRKRALAGRATGSRRGGARGGAAERRSVSRTVSRVGRRAEAGGAHARGSDRCRLRRSRGRQDHRGTAGIA